MWQSERAAVDAGRVAGAMRSLARGWEALAACVSEGDLRAAAVAMELLNLRQRQLDALIAPRGACSPSSPGSNTRDSA